MAKKQLKKRKVSAPVKKVSVKKRPVAHKSKNHPRSQRPKHVAKKVPAHVEEEVIEVVDPEVALQRRFSADGSRRRTSQNEIFIN